MNKKRLLGLVAIIGMAVALFFAGPPGALAQVAADTNAVVPYHTPAVPQIPDFITNFVQAFALTHPWLLAAAGIIGAIRPITKSIFTIVHDNFPKVEGNPIYAWSIWVIDLLFSVKIKKDTIPA